MKSLLCPLLVFAVTFVAACSLFGKEDRSDARITSRGVDGAEFGDSVSAVESELGPFDSWGFADGIRAWRVYYYREGPHKGMMLYFIEIDGLDEDGDSAVVVGPLDFITVGDRYDGQTAKGIGVGSTRGEVVRAYGDPLDIHGWYHFYCLDDRELNLTIIEDSVHALHLGYHVYPIDVSTYCTD